MLNLRSIGCALICALCLCSVRLAAADPALGQQLYEAVMYSDTAKVKELLAKGADANFAENGRSLLGWAAQTDNLAIVEALLEAKANPNHVDGVGHTPLMRAIDTWQVKNVQAIVKFKPDLTIRTREGKTILVMAADTAKPEIVEALIKAGADVKAVSEDGDSPALVAAQNGTPGSLEIIKLLGAAKAELNASNPAYTPLSYAISQENVALVKALLDAGADPNAKDKMGRTPLMSALGNKEIAEILLAAKADPNVTNERGETVLMGAVQEAGPEIVEALIKAGADLNKKDQYGSTALSRAENLYKQETVELLRKYGAS